MLQNSNHIMFINALIRLRENRNSKICGYLMTDKNLLFILYPNLFLYSDFLYFINSLSFDPMSFLIFVPIIFLLVFFHMLLCILFIYYYFYFLLLVVRRLDVFLSGLSALLFLHVDLKFQRQN